LRARESPQLGQAGIVPLLGAKYVAVSALLDPSAGKLETHEANEVLGATAIAVVVVAGGGTDVVRA